MPSRTRRHLAAIFVWRSVGAVFLELSWSFGCRAMQGWGLRMKVPVYGFRLVGFGFRVRFCRASRLETLGFRKPESPDGSGFTICS